MFLSILLFPGVPSSGEDGGVAEPSGRSLPPEKEEDGQDEDYKQLMADAPSLV
jgi:hypothetical protein